MAKRNTTGLPKKQNRRGDDSEAEPQTLIGRIQANLKDEQSAQQLIIGGVAALVILLVALVGGSLAWEYLIVPQQQVATVNGESISVAEFQERVQIERVVLNQRFNLDLGLLVELGQDPNQLLQQEPYGTWWQEITGQPELLGSRVLNEMIEEQLIRAAAEERGVTVDEEAVNSEVEEFFNFNRPDNETGASDEEPTATTIPSETPTPFVSPTPTSTPRPTNTPEPTPTPLAEDEAEATPDGPTPVPTSTPRPTSTPEPTLTVGEREERFNQRLTSFYSSAQRRADINEQAVRDYFEYRALLDVLREDVTADLGEETTYVNARHILVDSQEEAENILAALQEGESFAALAQAVSIDTGSGARGGDLGWSPASNYVPEFREAVEDAPIGEVVGPVESEFGFHIIQVSAREQREMTENEMERARSIAFEEWLEEVTNEDNHDVQRGDNWPQHVPLEPQFVYEPVTDATLTPTPAAP